MSCILSIFGCSKPLVDREVITKDAAFKQAVKTLATGLGELRVVGIAENLGMASILKRTDFSKLQNLRNAIDEARLVLATRAFELTESGGSTASRARLEAEREFIQQSFRNQEASNEQCAQELASLMTSIQEKAVHQAAMRIGHHSQTDLEKLFCHESARLISYGYFSSFLTAYTALRKEYYSIFK